MKACLRPWGVLLTAAAASVVTPVALAASTWNLVTGCTQNATNANTYGNSYNCTSAVGDPAITANAWSKSSNTKAGSTFAIANLAKYSGGFGVRNQNETLGVDEPNHAMDNSTQLDVLLLSFTQNVALNQVTIGWPDTPSSSYDTDISVLRYTGNSAPSMSGKTVGGLLSAGWELIGDYANLQDGVAMNVNAANKNSSWWLISAYNTGFGGGHSWSSSDYVKVLSVAATTTTQNNTPEPASLALAVAALAGIAGVRRRAAKPA